MLKLKSCRKKETLGPLFCTPFRHFSGVDTDALLPDTDAVAVSTIVGQS